MFVCACVTRWESCAINKVRLSRGCTPDFDGVEVCGNRHRWWRRSYSLELIFTRDPWNRLRAVHWTPGSRTRLSQSHEVIFFFNIRFQIGTYLLLLLFIGIFDISSPPPLKKNQFFGDEHGFWNPTAFVPIKFKSGIDWSWRSLV